MHRRLWLENLKAERDRIHDLDVDMRIILKLMLKEYDGMGLGLRGF
jgi:hypothetical protein